VAASIAASTLKVQKHLPRAHDAGHWGSTGTIHGWNDTVKQAHLKGEADFKPSPYLLALPKENRKFPPRMDPAQVLAAWDTAVAKIDAKQPLYQNSFREYKEDTRPPSKDLVTRGHLFTYITPPDPKVEEARRMLEEATKNIKKGTPDLTDEEAKAKAGIEAAAKGWQELRGYHHI